MQPVMLLREILQSHREIHTHLERRTRQGSIRSGLCSRSPMCLVRVSYENEGNGPVVLGTPLFVCLGVFTPKYFSIAKRSFHFEVISMLFLTPLQENCTLWEESALLWGREGWACEFAFANCVRSVPVMKENSSHLWKRGPRCENYVFR